LVNQHKHLTLANRVLLENLGNFSYSARVGVIKQSTDAKEAIWLGRDFSIYFVL